MCSESFSNASQSTLIFDDDVNEDDDAIIDASSIFRVVASSQSFHEERTELQNKDGDSDLDLAKLLLQLDSPESSQQQRDVTPLSSQPEVVTSAAEVALMSSQAAELEDIDSVLSQQTPVTSQGHGTEPEVDIDEEETLEMSQRVWNEEDDNQSNHM